MIVTTCHDPACRTARNLLALIRNSGEEPNVIVYPKTPRSRDELVEVPVMLPVVRIVLRSCGRYGHGRVA